MRNPLEFLKRRPGLARYGRRWVIFLGIVVVVALGLLKAFTQSIEAGYIGVIYDASRGLLNKVYEPRAVLVGWRQQLYTYPTKPQNAVYSQNPAEGEVKAADGILITTSDNANTTFNISVVYRVKKEDVFTVFNTFGAIPIDQIQSQHIRRAVRDGANNVGSQYTIFELVGTKRAEASEKLTGELRERLGPKGITIDHAMILRPYLSGETQARVTTSINSFTQIGISQLENQIAKVLSEASIVQAEAEKKARDITASKTQQKSLDMLNMELEAQAVQKWNGKLPPIQPQQGQTLVISGSQLGGLVGGRS